MGETPEEFDRYLSYILICEGGFLMSNEANNNIEARRKRVADVIALKEPDRVPFAPAIGTAYTQCSGVTKYEAMMDFRNFLPGIRRFLTRYDIDLFWSPATYPANVLEVLETDFIKWPGPTNGLALDAGFQITDKTFMSENEYDEFIADPSAFLFNKVYAARHKKLKGLGKAVINNVIEFGHFASLASFADPEVQEALHYLMRGGEEAAKWLKASAEIADLALELQTPLGSISGCTIGYDALADMLRGYINVPMDIYQVPDKVIAASDIMDSFAKKAVDQAAEMGLDYFFIPLHGGTDELMGDETYRKFYWPYLQRQIERLVDKGITPYILRVCY